MPETADGRTGTRRIPAVLVAFGAQPTSAVILAEDVAPGQRLRRGLRGLAVCWAAAAGAVLLPILHFVLVPSLVLAGIVAAIALGRVGQRMTSVRGECPRCHSQQEFEAGGRMRKERVIACPRCHTSLTLVAATGERAEAAPAGR